MQQHRSNRHHVLLLSILLGLLPLGCSVETFEEEAARFRQNAPPAPDPTPDPDPDPDPTPPAAGFNPIFSEIQDNLFTPTCATSGCHDASAAGGLNLGDGIAYAMLVDIPSSQVAGIDRVEPGSPVNSYLVRKIEGTASVGQQMPPGGTLPQPVIDVVRQWIIDGATDDTAAPPVMPASPVRVMSASPQPNAVLTASPTQIVAGFSRELDATSVNSNTFILERAGGDSTFDDGTDVMVVAASIAVPNNNRQSAIFDLTGVAMPDDLYRITLEGTGPSVIMDLDALALDGEFASVFPSGNGTAGGDFMAFFSISTPVVAGATLDEIQTNIFTPSCATAGCHTGPAGSMLPAGLDLSNADASFASLVNIASGQAMGETLVVPGSPDTSYLVDKVEGMAAVGNVMPPPPRPTLDAASIAVIRQWITDGALR